MSLKKNLKTYFGWMVEREKIRIKKEDGMPRPYTKDPILNEYKFTNVFRQDDRTTRELLKALDENLEAEPDDIFFNIALFRMFNWADTYWDNGGWTKRFNPDKHAVKLKKYKAEGHKVFTGAYIITNNGQSRDKIDLVCESLGIMYRHKKRIVKAIIDEGTLQGAVNVLTDFPMVGKFIGYELACDLSYTDILGEAPDLTTWANPGPGAKRGLNRLFRDDKDAKPKPANDEHYINEMRYLYDELFARGIDQQIASRWSIDMRVIENGLCEYDKYMRVKTGEGKPRSKY